MLLANADGGEQGGMEPAALLVATFEVEIGGSFEAGFGVEDGAPACAGIEPDIEDVGFLAEVVAAASGAFGSGGEQRVWGVLMPGFGSFAEE